MAAACPPGGYASTLSRLKAGVFGSDVYGRYCEQLIPMVQSFGAKHSSGADITWGVDMGQAPWLPMAPIEKDCLMHKQQR